jgi:urease accessory protein
MHMSKPYWEGGLLVVNAINATAGLFSGDAIVCEACVEEGASLLLTSPSAQRVHRMPEGEARVEQRFVVRSGGWLEVWPELFIPQSGARYRQRTRIEVEEGGELLFFEMVAPGRVAAGETFGYECLQWEMDLEYAGQLVVRERAALRPADKESLYSLTALFPAAYYASCFAVGPRFVASEECWEKVAALDSPQARLGCSRLAAGGGVVKILAGTGPDLRRVVGGVRQILYAAAGREGPLPRRP